MSHPTRPFVVVDLNGQILGDLPSPLLIQKGGGEAYEADGIWRLRDDSYDPPGTEYARVRVKRRPECPGDRTINMPHLVEVGTQLYGKRQVCEECAVYDGVKTGNPELEAGIET